MASRSRSGSSRRKGFIARTRRPKNCPIANIKAKSMPAGGNRKKADTAPQKQTLHVRTDHKKADTLQKIYDCAAAPSRYNRNMVGALPLQFFETALTLANG